MAYPEIGRTSLAARKYVCSHADGNRCQRLERVRHVVLSKSPLVCDRQLVPQLEDHHPLAPLGLAPLAEEKPRDHEGHGKKVPLVPCEI